LIVVVAIAAGVLGIFVVGDLDEDDWKTSLTALGLLIGISVAIAEAINYDLYGKTEDVSEAPRRFYLLLALVALGVNSIAVFIQRIANGWRPWRGEGYNWGESFGGIAVSIVGVIGFISSVLGIISFYLEHVAKK